MIIKNMGYENINIIFASGIAQANGLMTGPIGFVVGGIIGIIFVVIIIGLIFSVVRMFSGTK